MKVEYDVSVSNSSGGVYSEFFWKFYDSEHETVKIEFDSEEEARKAYRGFFNIVYYKKIKDIHVSKRKNTLYLIRSKT